MLQIYKHIGLKNYSTQMKMNMSRLAAKKTRTLAYVIAFLRETTSLGRAWIIDNLKLHRAAPSLRITSPLPLTMLSGRVVAQAARRAAIAPRTAFRSYAQAAAAPASTKPPVPLFGVDGTYASALVCLSRLHYLEWMDGSKCCGRKAKQRWNTSG